MKRELTILPFPEQPCALSHAAVPFGPPPWTCRSGQAYHAAFALGLPASPGVCVPSAGNVGMERNQL